jgi:AraC-like DNA-binding protein
MQRYDDVERLQTCFDGWHVELIQLGPRRLPAWASIALLPSTRIVHVHAGRSLVVRGTAPAADDCLILSSSRSTSIRSFGEPIDQRRFAVAGRGAPINVFLPDDATLCVIATKLIVGASSRRMQIRSTSAECISMLVGCSEAAVETNPSQHRSSPHALEEALLHEIRVAMEASALVESGAGARNLRASAVARACRFIDSHLAKPMTLADLSRHCGAGVRTLEYGFRQFYDTTPIGFIKSQRLTRTHNALTECCLQVAAISGIAKRLGFTHMGQYAQDYRALFGESPSMTLQRAQRQDKTQPDGDAPLRDVVS